MVPQHCYTHHYFYGDPDPQLNLFNVSGLFSGMSEIIPSD